MLGNRSFEFPISTLLRDSKRAHAILVARNRFLLDEFPPRGGASAGDKPATTTPAQ